MKEQKTKRLKLLIVEDEKAFDIALIDIRTPLMNGQELYLWITEHRPHLIPGIIFTTGDVISNSTEDFLTNMNQPYLPKPFSPKELTEIIEKVVSTL
ncbi:MAG: response regulator [Dehalogenimonas sp.]